MNLADYLIKNKLSTNVALKYKNEELTYNELYERCKQISYIIPRDGKIVGIFMPNCIEYVEAYFSILMMGKALLPFNSSLKSEEIKKIVHTCEIKTLLTLNKYKTLFESTQLDINIIYVDELEYKNVNISDKELPYLEVDENELAIIMPTSGTTGNEKYVQLTHKNLLANTEILLKMYNFKEGLRQLAILPFTSAFCNTVDLLLCICTGKTIVIYDGNIRIEKFYALIKNERITSCTLIPSILKLIVSLYDPTKHDISSLERICCGGEQLIGEDYEKITKIWGNVRLIPGYGMTEASPVIASITFDDHDYNIKSVGKPIPNVKVKIIDNNNNEVPIGTLGQIIAKGDNVMKGYYGFESTDIIKDGWLYTGDVGYLDEDGYLYVTGRIKNIIITGGQNVYPEEVEAILVNCDQIKEIRVLGEKNDNLGEAVIANIVLREGIEFNLNKIMQYCSQKLANYKIPRKFIVCDKLEKTVTNKIKR